MNKHEKSPCPTLTVWVPKKTVFTEFVKVNEHSKVEGGFSITIFCFALELLPFNVRPIFKPFINDKGDSNGTYDDLLKHIEGKVRYSFFLLKRQRKYATKPSEKLEMTNHLIKAKYNTPKLEPQPAYENLNT